MDEVKEGYFTMEDELGDLVAVEAGLTVFREFMAIYDERKQGVAAKVQMSEEERLRTMATMTMKELVKRTNTPGHEAKVWFKRLQQIQKI